MSHTSKILASAFAATSAVVLALISNTEASPTPLADPTPPPVAPQLDLSGSGYVASPGSPEVWGEPLGAVSAASVPGDDPGVICRFINFEGLGNRRSIPVFDGIQSPGWLSLIDLDSGGTGNFANEPSPSTVAFWRADPPGSRDILFSRAVSQVGFRYASAVTVVVEAFDSGGGVVDSATGAPNYLQGPGGDPTGGFDKGTLYRSRPPAIESLECASQGMSTRPGSTTFLCATSSPYTASSSLRQRKSSKRSMS